MLRRRLLRHTRMSDWGSARLCHIPFVVLFMFNVACPGADSGDVGPIPSASGARVSEGPRVSPPQTSAGPVEPGPPGVEGRALSDEADGSNTAEPPQPVGVEAPGAEDVVEGGARTDEERPVSGQRAGGEGEGGEDEGDVQEGPCPEGMVYIDAEYCPKMFDTCLEVGQYNRPPKHPRICRTFDTKRRCLSRTRRQRFCIDKYEYPNQKGAHPPVMVNAWMSVVLCEREGKRLCWDSEWTIACEGSKKTPFPYGYVRDSTKCNQDKEHIRPNYRNMDPENPERFNAEMARLDQSVPSGSMDTCVSDYGVYDLTGNFDEWTFLEKPRGRGRWGATKGGWWGRVRNACRPVGTGHPESFMYFPTTTRCCKDPNPAALPEAPDELKKLRLWKRRVPQSSLKLPERFFEWPWVPDDAPNPRPQYEVSSP